MVMRRQNTLRQAARLISTNARSCLLMMLQGVLVSADRFSVGRVPLRELPGFLPVSLAPASSPARADAWRAFRRRFGDRRVQAHEGFGDWA